MKIPNIPFRRNKLDAFGRLVSIGWISVKNADNHIFGIAPGERIPEGYRRHQRYREVIDFSTLTEKECEALLAKHCPFIEKIAVEGDNKEEVATKKKKKAEELPPTDETE